MVVVLILLGLCGTCQLGASPPSGPVQTNQTVKGTVHREGKETFRFTFAKSGTVNVELRDFPADCAFQVGSQGFGESEVSPVDWTDGRPGEPVTHSFKVQAGRPGTIWVDLRSRLSGVSRGGWTAVACSKDGPYYTTPARDGPVEKGPETFEGQPVGAPITFTLTVKVEGAPASAAADTNPTPPKPPLTSSGATQFGFTAESLADPEALLVPLDEASAMSRVQSSPTKENKQALAVIRIRHAWTLLESARRLKDPDGLQLACEYAQSATELAPRISAGWIVLAQAYQEFDSPAALTLAEDAARRALALEPANQNVRLLLAQVQFKQRFYDSALASFEAAVSAQLSMASPTVVSMMALAYMFDGQSPRGEKYFTQLLGKQPGADSARLALAILLHHQGKDTLAREQLRKVELSPQVTAANRMYAVKLAELWSKEAK